MLMDVKEYVLCAYVSKMYIPLLFRLLKKFNELVFMSFEITI